MAITYGFFDSEDGDRRYEASHFNQLFDGIIKDGVFESVGDHLAVTNSNNGMVIYVGTGRAWFNRTWTYNDAIYPLVLSVGTNLPRIDAVVLEINKNNDERINTIKVIEGQTSSTPVKPTLINSDELKIYQYALAYITIPAGATDIDDENIEIVVGDENETPYVSAELKQSDIENIILGFEDRFNEYYADWKKQEYSDFRDVWMSSIVNELSTSQIGALQAAILNKETKPILLSQVLAVGQFELNFYNVSGLTEDSYIDVYSDPYGARLKTASQSGNQIYLKFDPVDQETTIFIAVRNP